ncbi:hypothetical protein ABEF95_007045 [Exophiala dermatitidis]
MSQGTIGKSSEIQKTPNVQNPAASPTPVRTAVLDRRLHHLREAVLPRQPYLLSVPSDVPYRHSSRFINTWYEGTPFSPQEEQIQYVSFLPHQGEHEALLKVEGGWADEQGNPIVEEVSPKTLPVSGRNTPAETARRKKISLKDYKTKGRSPPESTSLRRPPQEPLREANEQPKEEQSAVDNKEVVQVKKQDTVDSSKVAVASQESVSGSPIVGLDGPNSPRSHPEIQQVSPPPARRTELQPPPEDIKAESPVVTSSVMSQARVMKMPRLLSPTLPSPEEESGLPELLSPVLPPSLAKAISSPSDTTSPRSPVPAPHHRSEPVRSILARADLDGDFLADKNKLSVAGSRVRSDSQHSARSSAPGSPNAGKVSLGTKHLSKAGIKAGTSLQNGARASPGPRQRHTIILKYGKKNRKRVESLLKLAPRSKKDVSKHDAVDGQVSSEGPSKKETQSHESAGAQQSATSKPQAKAVESIMSEKKRKAEDSPGPSLKKTRLTNLSNDDERRPATPTPSAGKTPFVGQSKSAFSTPKRDVKAAAMKRIESSEGLDVPTPSADRVRVSTPLTVPKPSPKPSPQPPVSSHGRPEERQQWTDLNDKFFALGRTLKHEGSSLLSQPDVESRSSQSAKAIITLTEGLICFMINIAANSYVRPGADPGWRSIILYHISIYRASRPFLHLHGLVVQLGAVCRQQIQKYDMERLARDPLPEDYCNSAPTPGSDGNTKTNEDSVKYKKRYVEFKDELVHNARELQTAWLDGSRYLPLEVLRREYPKTWSKRMVDTSSRLQEKPTPSKIPKHFCLPLDPNTTAFEAARFAVAFLEEWAEKEKIDWKTRIDL